jgi:hypothetical protein
LELNAKRKMIVYGFIVPELNAKRKMFAYGFIVPVVGTGKVTISCITLHLHNCKKEIIIVVFIP